MRRTGGADGLEHVLGAVAVGVGVRVLDDIVFDAAALGDGADRAPRQSTRRLRQTERERGEERQRQGAWRTEGYRGTRYVASYFSNLCITGKLATS